MLHLIHNLLIQLPTGPLPGPRDPMLPLKCTSDLQTELSPIRAPASEVQRMQHIQLSSVRLRSLPPLAQLLSAQPHAL